jgi:transposase
MQQLTTTPMPLTIGLDLGARQTQCAVLSADGTRIEERKVSTTSTALRSLFERHPDARVVMEASTPARWISKLAKELGHEVVVANPRNIPIITASTRKCDRNDARLLADLGQVRPQLLSPVQLRADRYQAVRALLFARAQLVKQRTALVTFVRSEVKALGATLPSCSSRAFAGRMRTAIPKALVSPLSGIFDVLQVITTSIDEHDRSIERLSEGSFPETATVRQVHGVGPLIALAFVATIGGPERFGKSRSVGAYFGLVPRLCQSGGYDPELRITKTGDRFMRSLLVSAATRILGPFGPDSDLRRYGERITAQGGKRAKARARIAVARKLAVLLHRLLASGEVYEPLRNNHDN